MTFLITVTKYLIENTQEGVVDLVHSYRRSSWPWWRGGAAEVGLSVVVAGACTEGFSHGADQVMQMGWEAGTSSNLQGSLLVL